MKKLILLLVTVCLFAMSGVAAASGTDIGDGFITVQGYGAAAQSANPTYGRLMARRAAVVDAYRQLAEAVQGVNVDAQTTVQNMIVTSDVINTRVNAVINGARIMSEQALPEGGYEVTMQMPVFGGQNSLAAAVLPQTLPQERESFPSVAGSYNATRGGSSAADPRGAAGLNVQVQGNYTGVIIDCSAFELRTAMSPVILTDGGQKIYGYKNLDYKKVISKGMAGYVKAGQSSPRAGMNPLVLYAVDVADGVNPVLSQADADRMLLENQRSHFLDECNVVFVR